MVIRKCTEAECPDCYRVPNYCMLMGRGLQNVSEGAECSFFFSLTKETKPRVQDSELEQSLGGPDFSTPKGRVEFLKVFLALQTYE